MLGPHRGIGRRATFDHRPVGHGPMGAAGRAHHGLAEVFLNGRDIMKEKTRGVRPPLRGAEVSAYVRQSAGGEPSTRPTS